MQVFEHEKSTRKAAGGRLGCGGGGEGGAGEEGGGGQGGGAAVAAAVCHVSSNDRRLRVPSRANCRVQNTKAVCISGGTPNMCVSH